MDPVQETRARPLKSLNALFLPKLANDVKDLVRKEPKKNENQDSEESDQLSIEEDPRDFFKSIIFDLIPDICLSDNERIMKRYDNKMNPFNKKASLGDRLKQVPPCKFKECLSSLKIKPHPNTICPQIRHLPVLQQHRGSMCGFHMIYNAKCLVRALLGQKQFDQIHNLVNLDCQRKFLADVRRTKRLLLKCTNGYYVSEGDKKQLQSQDPVLDRSHLTYLLFSDPELLELQKQEEGKMPVYMNMIEYSFGLMHRTIDQIIALDRQIREFQLLEKKAIFVIFVGVVNHWVAFVVQKKGCRALPGYQLDHYKKGKKTDYKFYLMDSSNFVHLNKLELELPDLIMERVRQKIRLGLKAASKFSIQMTIQSMFDQRAVFAKLIQVFNNDGLNEQHKLKYEDPTLCKFYASGFINNILEHFQQATEHMGKCGDLKVPVNGLFFEEKRGQKSMAELQQEMLRKQKFEREKAAREARMAEAKRLKEKQEKKQAAMQKVREAERAKVLAEREAAKLQKNKILGIVTSDNEEDSKVGSPRQVVGSPTAAKQSTVSARAQREEDKKEEDQEELSSEEDLDSMEAGDYIHKVQRETYAENIERALRMNEHQWDIQEFIYHEKHVEGIYSYLDKFYDDDYEHLNQYYESCFTFMKTGHLPKEIQSKTMKYVWAFGPNQIFEKDNEKLNAWAASIQILDFKLRHNEEFMTLNVRKREIERDQDLDIDAEQNEEYWQVVAQNETIDQKQQLFNELVSLAAKIKETFVPFGRPGRFPKLFAEL